MPNDPGISFIAVTQGIGVFMYFLPKYSDIRKATKEVDKTITADVRMGEIAASVVTLGVGAILSSLSKSSTPMMIASVVVIGLVTLYELTLITIPEEVKNA